MRNVDGSYTVWTADASPRQPSETPSGHFRVPWRRSLLVPIVPFEGERSERMC